MSTGAPLTPGAIGPGSSGLDADTATISWDEINVRFGNNQVLDGVSIAFRSGFNGLIGPNGAGKTTCFNVANGFVAPTSGQVKLGGVDVRGMNPVKRARLGIARTFQTPRLVLEMTVLENVLVGMEKRHHAGHVREVLAFPSARREARDLAEQSMDLLRHFGLHALARERAGSLSLGSQKLVEVARALATQSKVLLLDEPAAGLSAADTTAMVDGLQHVVEGTSLCVVIVEHDLQLIMSLCSSVAVLDFGRIISQGTPEMILQDKTVVDAYLGAGFATGD